ncbi:MAG: hypothetical protein KDD56_07890 [Bdellovibrionales bacterium]|nr:hypothetical protein [Bdellovibrionales bacterium]
MLYCEIKNMNTKDLFLFCTRWAFGIWLVYIGAMKFVGGIDAYMAYMTGMFASTWVPPMLVQTMAVVIAVAEPVLGLMLVRNIRPRFTWVLVTCLMFTLTFGLTVLEQYPMVANNWQYLILAIVAASMSDPE